MVTNLTIPKSISKRRYGEFWGKIWSEVHDREGIVTIVFCGKRGKGKSRSMCQMARVLDCGPDGISRFKPDDVKFDVVDFLKSITGKYPIGKVHVLDDAGLHMYKSDALTNVLKKVSKVLQGIRYKHPIIMLSLPHFEQLVKDARGMSDIYVEMVKIDRREKIAYGKIQILRISPFDSFQYRTNLLQKDFEFNPNVGIMSEHWKENLYGFRMPDKEFDKQYEKRKNSELDKVNSELISSVEDEKAFEAGTNKPKKMPFSEAVAYVKERIDKVKDKKGVINTSKIMLLKDEEGRELFSASRARMISSVLK